MAFRRYSMDKGNAFRRQILEQDSGDLKYSAQVHAYDDLVNNHREKGFMQDEAVRLAFQTDFVKYGMRLLRIFETGKKLGQESGRRTSTKLLAREVLDEFVVPLLDDEFDSFAEMNVMVHLVSTIADFTLFFDETRHVNSMLFPQRLADKPKFLEQFASDPFGAKVFKDLAEHEYLYRSINSTQKIARRLAVLCYSCTSGHGVNTGLKRWYNLVSVLGNLNDILATLDKEFIERSRENKTHPTRALRKLSIDEKKSHYRKSSASDAASLNLPDNITTQLLELRLRLPTSRGSLSELINEIMTEEIPAILRLLVKTFPCRVCHEASNHSSNDQQLTTFDMSGNIKDDTQESSHQPLFGEQSGVWKVLLSAQTLKDLKRLAHAGRFPQVDVKLRSLSSGAWKNGNLSNRTGNASQRANMKSPLLTANCGRDLRILWQIDVGYYEETASYKQLVKVWTVAESEDVDKAVDQVITVQKSQRFSSGLKKKPFLDSSGTYIPMEFPAHETAMASAVPVNVSDQRAIELSNKFYALTKPVLESFLAGNITAEFPFETSREEVEIIKHYETGTLILGRSGTGKTTCLVYQLLKKYVARRQILGESAIRQVLVTRSSVLAEKLKTYTKRLIESQLNKRIWIDIDQDDLNEYKGALEEDLDQRTLFDLSDDAFPLVCSFDQLLTLIDNTLADADRQHFRTSQGPVSPTGVRLGSFVRRTQVVDFNLFKNEYWDQFSPDLTRGIAPQLVFSEIMGVIKGSASKETSFSPLSHDQYLSRSCRLAPTFTTENGREAVYNLYEAYEKKKSLLGDIDGIDRVLGLLRRLENDMVTRKKVERLLEEIYVDEIQDQRCLEIILLLNLVRNPRGIHFAGDTAQCISKDSTFRFQDIKAIFFETFSPILVASNESHLSVPALFTLTKNYRSHQGIISLACYVMKILYTTFPNTVDKLPPEQGQNEGPKPAFFVGFNEELIADSMVGLNKANQNISDFGSEQVILVRDDTMKRHLQEYLRDKAVVLTILESKGMEFEDVLLFGFFSESPCKAGYRSLQGALTNTGKDFDIIKHAELCSELKNLYVAITRPRARLWIVESSVESSQPSIKIFTQEEPLVKVYTPSDPDIEVKKLDLRAAATTDPIRFIERGNELLQRGLFKEALIRFKSGNDQHGQTKALGYIYHQQGVQARGNRDEALFVESFEKALDCFREVKLIQNVAICLEELNRFCEAADIRINMVPPQYSRAAELYIKGNDPKKASCVFHNMRNYDRAASTLLKGEFFDDFTEYLAENRDRLSQQKVTDYSRLVNMLFKQGRIDPKLQDLTTSTLGTDEEKVKYFKAAGLTQKLAEHYESKNEFWSVYTTQLADGEIVAALTALARAKAAQHPLSLTEKFKDACLDLSPYAHAWDFAEKFGQSTTKSPEKVEYINLHPEARLRARIWERFSSFIEESRTKNFSETPWAFDDTFNMLYTMNAIGLNLLNSIQSMEDFKISINAVRRVLSVLQTINDRTPPNKLPLSFRVSLGLLLHSDMLEKIIILDYSPLRGKLPRICDSTEAIVCGLKLVAHGLLDLAYEIDEKAKGPWSIEDSRICTDYAVSGSCKRQLCKNHRKLMDSDCKKKIESLMEMASIFSSLTYIYYNYKRYNTEQRFLGTRRKWLERLLVELTFVTAFEHDPSRIKSAREEISQGQGIRRIILSSLKDLLLYRIEGKEWDARNNLSSWLDQIELADWLSQPTAYQFHKASRQTIINKISEYKRLDNPKYYPLINMNYALIYISSCNKAIGNGNVKEFSQSLHQLCDALNILTEDQYRNFYTVVSTFEFLASYLICMVCGRNNHLLFPKSWIALHLPKFNTEQASEMTIDKRTEAVDILGECFLYLLNNFMEILHYLDNIPQKARYTFNQQSYDSRMMSRRNISFLIICVLNIYAMPNRPRNFVQVWEHTKQILKFHPPYIKHPKYIDIYQTAEALESTFNNPSSGYTGKDSLVLLRTSNSNKQVPTHAVFSVLRTVSQNQDFKSTVSSYAPGWSPHKKDDQESETNSDETYTPGEEAAIITIQRWWKVRKPLLFKHREFLKTDEGKATEFVKMIISSTNFAKLSYYKGAKFILLGSGVIVYTKYRRLKNRLKACNDRANRLAEDRKTSIEATERLQKIIFEELDQYQTDFKKSFEAIDRKQILNLLVEADADADTELPPQPTLFSALRGMFSYASSEGNSQIERTLGGPDSSGEPEKMQDQLVTKRERALKELQDTLNVTLESARKTEGKMRKLEKELNTLDPAPKKKQKT